MKNLEDLEQSSLELRLKGVDFSVIRKELKGKGVSDSDIRSIINSIEDKILSGTEVKRKPSNIDLTKFIGILLVLLGVGITIGTYSGWIDMKGYFLFSYGPILGGLGMIVSSKRGRSEKFNRSGRIGK